MVFHQRAPFDRAAGFDPDERKSGIVSDIILAVQCEYVLGFLAQFLRHIVYVPWVQKDILPVDAAFAALVTVEPERFIYANFHLIQVLCNLF